MSTTTPNLNLIQPSKSEKGGWTTYITNNTAIDTAYGEYLNDREQSLENIAPIEGNTASKNYTVGSYLVKDGGLYKVTAAIASGESIVVGTNVVATSLNDAVVELNNALDDIVITRTYSIDHDVHIGFVYQTITIPSGYKLACGHPIACFTSGNEATYVTDSYARLNQTNNTVTVEIYVHNTVGASVRVVYALLFIKA